MRDTADETDTERKLMIHKELFKIKIRYESGGKTCKANSYTHRSKNSPQT